MQFYSIQCQANKSWTMGIGIKKEVKTQNTHSFPLISADI